MDMTKEQIRGNLIDAGCDSSIIEQFESLDASGRQAEQERLLKCYRCQLMDRIHKEQKKLDCLDYLIYAMKSRTSPERRRLR